ncbi:MAG: NAD-dependent epimerase/dehydratase family protein [Rhodospirillaceae bacterium]|nr:NAD-dependent epimerase/dehydratase family protein [Rhodospirillaceae bacterium]
MVGANLVHRLVSLGIRPTVMVRSTSSLARLEGLTSAIDLVNVDLTNARQTAECLKALQPGLVFHLASSFFNPPTLSATDHLATNALGTINLCEALKASGSLFPRLIYAGSCGVYAGGTRLTEDTPIDPGSMYGVAKAAGSTIVRTFGRLAGFHTLELRLFGLFGPFESPHRLIPHAILSALTGTDIRIGDGRQRRDYVYIEDVINAFILAASRPVPSGTVLHIASGTGHSIHDVATRILELTGANVTIQTATRPTRPDEIWEMSGDATSALTHLGWVPQTDFTDGLRHAIDWFRDNRTLAERLGNF